MSLISSPGDEGRSRRRLTVDIRDSMRELSMQLTLLNQRVSARIEVRPVDLNCLDVIARRGPLSPSALARHTGLHPATITGILDRLERAHWVVRDRDPHDRRAVLVRALPDRGAEIFRLYAGMNSAVERICADYADEELRLLADFLHRTAAAGGVATDELAADQPAGGE
ncbi:MAG TPA: MarR family transcriptional regulator [Pseudonocardiaceae bacterium]